jgi:hypothetical protein
MAKKLNLQESRVVFVVPTVGFDLLYALTVNRRGVPTPIGELSY